MKDTKTYTLTKAEIQIMNILWEMPEGGCVHDIIGQYEEPKPAYTTIATFMKILFNKRLPTRPDQCPCLTVITQLLQFHCGNTTTNGV